MLKYWQDNKRTPTKARWVRILAAAMLAWVGVAVAALFAKNIAVLICALILAGVCIGAAGEIVYHGFLLTMAMFLAPFAIAMYELGHGNDGVWRKWQFWVLSAGFEIIGGYMLLLLGRNYRASNQ